MENMVSAVYTTRLKNAKTTNLWHHNTLLTQTPMLFQTHLFYARINSKLILYPILLITSGKQLSTIRRCFIYIFSFLIDHSQRTLIFVQSYYKKNSWIFISNVMISREILFIFFFSQKQKLMKYLLSIL